MRMSLTDVGLASWLNSPLCQRGAGGDFPLFIEGVAHLDQLQIPPAPLYERGSVLKPPYNRQHSNVLLHQNCD